MNPPAPRNTELLSEAVLEQSTHIYSRPRLCVSTKKKKKKIIKRAGLPLRTQAVQTEWKIQYSPCVQGRRQKRPSGCSEA